MNTEAQRLLSRALYYVEAALEDMKWEWSGNDLDFFNMGTSGTKCFDTEEELEQYLADMEKFVNELKEVLE